MPFEIVRNDIVNMQVDAIVNTANPKPIVGYGCDAGIHQKAGPELLAARQKIGSLKVGEVAVTPGFNLAAKYVMHAVGPIWEGGGKHEKELLRRCYDRALALAVENDCESIAFPLLSAGNHGFPKPLALQIAINAFSSFLMEHEMEIYLVVFSRDALILSEKLFHSVASYIDENYIHDATLAEYGLSNKREIRELELEQIRRGLRERESTMIRANGLYADELLPPVAEENKQELEALLKAPEAGFSETLLKLIDQSRQKDSAVYKKANVDRKHFSKIRNNPDYKPSKATVLAFALALELDLAETNALLASAGFALTHASKFDIIVEYFIKEQKYDVFEVNEVLFYYDLPLLGI